MQNRKQNKKSSFFYAFALLPKEKREAMNVFYTFSRLSDEIADDENASAREKAEKFARWENEFYAALENKGENALLNSLAEIIRRFEIPKIYFYELLAGIKSDLNFKQPQTVAELDRYAYSVASTVGLITIRILGYKNADAEIFATDLGKALQITNIMRDVKKDLRNGRIYLPADLLRKNGVTRKDLEKGKRTEQFVRAMRELYLHAENYYNNAWRIFPREDFGTLYPGSAMGKIYYELLLKIKKNDFDVFGKEIKISVPKRILIVLREIIKGAAAR